MVTCLWVLMVVLGLIYVWFIVAWLIIWGFGCGILFKIVGCPGFAVLWIWCLRFFGGFVYLFAVWCLLARVVWVLDVGLLWLVFAGFCFVLLVLDLGLFVGLVYFGFLLVWVSVGVCSGVVLGHLFGAVL